MAKTTVTPMAKARAAFNKAMQDVAANKPGAKARLKKAHERLASLSCRLASASPSAKRKTTKRKTTKRKTTKRKTLRKGSPEAKAYMAKIRAKRGKKKVK